MRDRRGAKAVVILGTVALLILVALGAGSSWGQVISILPRNPAPYVAPQSAPQAQPETPEENPLSELADVKPIDIPDWLIGLATALLVLAAVVIVAWLLKMVVNAARKPGLRRADAASGSVVEITQIDQEEVSASLGETLARLRSGVAVDDVIVECWRRLEAIAADSGIRRKASQTSEEFTVQILASALVAREPIEELAALYSEALFSTHQLTDTDRERAISCVERLASQMGVSRAG